MATVLRGPQVTNPRNYLRSPPSWTWSYNSNLIAQDALPVGAQSYDLAPATPGYRNPPSRTIEDLNTWIRKYNPNLIGKDAFPPGKVHFERQYGQSYVRERAYREWTQQLLGPRAFTALMPRNQYDWPNPRAKSPPGLTWLWSYNRNLIGKDILPRNQKDWPLPRPKRFLNDDNNWTWSYNNNLIGKDRFPPGTQNDERRMWHQYIRDRAYRDWSQNLVINQVIGSPFNQYDWPLPARALQPYRSYELSYNLTLDGQDDIGIRHLWNIARGHQYQQNSAYRDWSWNGVNTILAPTAQLPFSQLDWPLSTPPTRQPDLRTWAAWYNQNLIAQDQFPAGEITTDLVPRGYPRKDQTWTWWYSLPLIGQDQLPTGEIVYERPPRGPLQPDRFYGWSYNLNLIGQDLFPPGDIRDTLVPKGSPPQVPSWAAWYNLNLIGQDVVPTGSIRTDRPPPVSWYRDWTNNLLQTTLSVINVPFNQFDWPNPRDYRRVTPTWTWDYNRNLIGKDQLPAGTQVDDRPPPVMWYRDWAQSLVNSTLVVVFNLPFNQYDWPNPRDYLRVTPSWARWFELNLVAQDVFPPGQIRTDLPVRLTWFQDWSQNLLNTPFTVTPVPPIIPPTPQEEQPPGAGVWREIRGQKGHGVYGRAWKDAYRKELERLGLPPPPEDIPEPGSFEAAVQELPGAPEPGYTPEGIEAEERYEALRSQQVELIRQKAREVALTRARAIQDAQNAAWLLLMGD